jgi:hypothetical protein
MVCKLHHQEDCIPCTFIPGNGGGGEGITKPGKKSAKRKAGEPDADGNIAGSFKGRLRVCEVKSDSNPKRAYAVCIKDGIWECACPAWTRGNVLRADARETATGATIRRQDCKHIARVQKWFARQMKAEDMGQQHVFKIHLAKGISAGITPCKQWIDFATKGTPEQQDAVFALLSLLGQEDPLTVAGAWNSIWAVMTMEQD